MEPTPPTSGGCRRVIEYSAAKQTVDCELDPEQPPEKDVPPVIGYQIGGSATGTRANPQAFLHMVGSGSISGSAGR